MFDARYFDNEDDSLETEVKLTTDFSQTELPTTTQKTNWLRLEPDLDKFFAPDSSMENDYEDDEDERGSGEDESKWVCFLTFLDQ